MVDPWGCVVAENSDDVGVMVVDIDLDLVRDKRQNMPVQTHRRYDVYGHIHAHSSGE